MGVNLISTPNQRLSIYVADISTLHWEMKRCLSLYQWGVLIRPQRHHIRLYGVFVLLVYSFTYPGCLRPGSSGSPGGSDSPGYLSPDHPHPGSATLLSPRIIQPDYIPRQSAQARILATDTTCSGYMHVTLKNEINISPSISEGCL